MDTIEKALKKQQDKSHKNEKFKPEVFDQLADSELANGEIVNNAKLGYSEDKPIVASVEKAIEFDKPIEVDKPIEQSQEKENITNLPAEDSKGTPLKLDVEENNLDKKSQKVTIDLSELLSLGFLVDNSSNTVMNEEYRQIKRPLLRNIRGKSAHPIKHANIIQVTSSLQGEGKTFTAINLALAFAMELDYNVLLVDADTIKSSITRTLLNTTKPGLTEYLSGEIEDLSKLMLTTNIPKLTILPAGNRNLLSTELLNSKYMENLIEEFSQRYKNRIVIIDSPPILQTNDARILAQKVGQIVFVVEHNKTTQSVVKSATSLLDPEMVVGLVLNKNRTNSKNSYYGYYGPAD